MTIKLFFLYRIMGQLLPIYPVYLLMFQQKGLSLAEVSLLLIIWSLPGLLLELPSSVLADCWNRKKMLVIGRLLKGLCFFVWSGSDSFWGFAAGFALWGTGGAFCSGTEEAWLYDALKSSGREAEYDRIWGKSTFYDQLSVGIVSIAGSILATVSMYLTLRLSILSILISAAVAAMLPEHNLYRRAHRETAFPKRHAVRNYTKTLKDGMVYCWQHADITALVGMNMTVLVTAGILDEYDQLIVRYMGVPLALVGLWGFFRYGMEGLGGRFAWRLKCWLNRFGVKEPVSIQLLIGAGAGIFLGISAGFPILYALPLYALYYLLLSSGKVLYTEALQAGIREEGRATVQSFSSVLEVPAGILIYGIFGAVGGQGRLPLALGSVVIWMFSFSLVFLMLYRKRKGSVAYEQ